MTSEGADGGMYFMSLENVDLRWRRLVLPDPTPCARSHHSAAAIGSKIYIFGGKDANGTVLNDLWMIDFAGETPTCVQIAEQSTWPSARYHFASVSLPTQSAFVLLGGKSQSEQAPDDLLWIWEHRKQAWQSQAQELSSPRYGHSLSLLSPTKICLIGGASIVDPNAEATKQTSAVAFEGLTRAIVLDEEHASQAEASNSEEVVAKNHRGGPSRGRERKNSRAVARGSVSALVATYSPPVSATASPAPAPTPAATLAAPTGPILQRETSASSETTSVTDSTDDQATNPSDAEDVEQPDSEPVVEPAHEPIVEPHQTINLNHTKQGQHDHEDDRHHEPESPHPSFEPEAVVPLKPIQPVEAPIEEVQLPAIIPTFASLDVSSPFDEVPDSPIPPPPEDEPTSPIASNRSIEPIPVASVEIKANGAGHGATAGENAVPSGVAPVNPATAAIKRAGANRMRSARISTSSNAFLGMLIAKPGNSEWIDFMDPEQLRLELKAMTNFVYNIKSTVETSDSGADETLQQVRALFANELPKFTPPAIARLNASSNGESSGPTSPPSSASDSEDVPIQPATYQPTSQPSSKFSIALISPTSAPASSVFPQDLTSSFDAPLSPKTMTLNASTDSSGPAPSESSHAAVSAPMPITALPAIPFIPHAFIASASPATSPSPGSGKLWGATASPGSGRDRDSNFLSHRASVMFGSATTLPASSTSPPTQSSDASLRIGSRGSLSLSNSPIPSPAPESFGMSPSSSSSALASSQSNNAHVRSGSGTGTGTPPTLSPSSSTSNLVKSTSTESLTNKRSTIVVKEFDLSSTAEKQAAMVESQLDASYSIPTTSCPDTEQSRRDREYAVQELLDTESKYVRDLNLIVEQFQKPLQANNVLNARQLSDIFSIIRDFIPLHEQLLKELSETVNKPYAEQCPGQIFLAMADYLKMYTGFCASQTNIAQRISDLTKSNSTFRKFLDAKLKDEKLRGLTLTAFLVMPIQRVCRFPLLLKQIAKSTPVSHPDFKKLHLGIFKVDKVVLAVNEGKRTLEAQAQMYELEQSLAWDKQKAPANFVFIDPSRRLVTSETHVEWLPASSKEKIELIHLLVFNDLILLARPKEGTTQRKIRRAFALATTNLGIDDALDTSSGKSTLQLTFGDETINLAFSSKEKRSEAQMAIAESKQKLPDSTAVRETITALETYHSQH